ncbi:hypothetical protein [Kitasatospora aureofaciens]
MEQQSVMRHRVDWAQLRRRVLEQAHGARTASDTYGVIAWALNSLGDGHSFFLDPQQSGARLGATTLSFEGLTGRALEDGLGYVSLP